LRQCSPHLNRLVLSLLTSATLLLVGLAPRAASAVQSSELYRSQAYFYGRFEARVRFAPGEGVVSSFFLWRDGSSSSTSWNELDFEKINSTCKLQTNIWTGKGTQSTEIDTPSFDICADYHTYAFEWTADYIAWFIDGKQVRKVTGASVTEYTKNAAQGMSMHFNTWEGNSTFGGTLNTSTLPVHEYISWAQYSSYTNGAFQMQWREEFDGSSIPSGWLTGNWASPNNLSTHNPANVTFGGGIAVLSMTADNATGFTGTPPADSSATPPTGTGGSTGSGSGGTTATGGATGTGGASATGGNRGTAGTPGTGSGGTPGTGNGGTRGTGNGGSSATGGASATGGTSASGGATGTGGSASVTGAGGASATGSGGSSATGGSGAPGSGGTSATGGSSNDGAGQTGSSGGCSCGVGDLTPAGSGGLMTGLLAVAYALRRRRDRRPQ